MASHRIIRCKAAAAEHRTGLLRGVAYKKGFRKVSAMLFTRMEVPIENDRPILACTWGQHAEATGKVGCTFRIICEQQTQGRRCGSTHSVQQALYHGAPLRISCIPVNAPDIWG